MNTENKTANILLERGVREKVSTPFFFRISITVKAPTSYNLLRIAEIFTRYKFDLDKELSMSESMQMYRMLYKAKSRIIAIATLNPLMQRPIAERLLAWLIRHSMHESKMNMLYKLIILYGGVEDFVSTIRLIEESRITKPMNLNNLSPEAERS